MGEGTTRRGTATPEHRPQRPAGSIGPGKPNLPLGLRGKAGGGARVTAGPKRPHLSVCPGPNFPLQGRQGISGLHSRLPRGVRPRLEGKPRIPLSSRVATRVSWSPLSGLKGPQHSENSDHVIWSHHFMANRWGNNGNSGRLFFARPDSPGESGMQPRDPLPSLERKIRSRTHA